MKITEIIPDDMPEWAIKSMSKGQLFNDTFNRISLLEAMVEKLVCAGLPLVYDEFTEDEGVEILLTLQAVINEASALSINI